ncbi:MAG TPA: peptide chain release factor H [Permianibacter sp.]|nr:peptide chain release factor H [Permianibacter sp.]
MILLQLSAAQGPAECALAVAKAWHRLQQDAQAMAVGVTEIESAPGPHPGTYASVLLHLDGDAAATLAARWCGSLLWICRSPYRPQHGRKNWFFSGVVVAAPAPAFARDVRFETLRSCGPGGQHVNRTESAVRAIHVGTGMSVKVQSERSQHANKRLALLLLAQRLDMQQQRATIAARNDRRLQARVMPRGNPSRRFVGPDFVADNRPGVVPD